MNDLDELRPLHENDAAFTMAVQAMRNAAQNRLSSGKSREFWMVDRSAVDAADMVGIVDVAALGRIAKGIKNWDFYAETLTIYPFENRHSAGDVVEALVHLLSRPTKPGNSD